jgi:hypothetical protein
MGGYAVDEFDAMSDFRRSQEMTPCRTSEAQYRDAVLSDIQFNLAHRSTSPGQASAIGLPGNNLSFFLRCLPSAWFRLRGKKRSAVPAGFEPAFSPRENSFAERDKSLIETTLSRDILLMSRVDKPALLRRLFLLGCHYSGQILSYQKMLGQLQDAGNTTTLAHYLDLLAGAGMLKGVPKFSGKKVLQRGSSPKLHVLNTALMTAQSRLGYTAAKKDRDYWGRLVESAVGAHLLNSIAGTMLELYYWRERGQEVDFVLQSGRRIVPIEVKSGRAREGFPGMESFEKNFRPHRRLLVGGQGIPLDEFLAAPITNWVD